MNSPESEYTKTEGDDAMLDGLDLSLSLTFPTQDQWDMDTDISAFMPAVDPAHTFSLDPSTLHFDYPAPSEHIPPPPPDSASYDSLFQFAFAQPTDSTFQLPTPKPSSTSTSSRSASPESDGSAGVNPSDLSLFSQLGQRARDTAGVMLAVPDQGGTEGQPPVTPISPVLSDAAPHPKLPIPRLRPAVTTTPAVPQLLPQPQQPTTPPTSDASPPASAPAPRRPKTSHTTIERRYRTNLNARILALRRAVPALRILEKNTSTQTQGKGLTGASAAKWDFDDVINERGYVDGVKAAKKNSKGVVLGKAVEYIRALKRRELRLKRESAGLRALVTGLVGGPVLLAAWEQEWTARFGGEEADEVGEDEEEGDDAEGGEGEGEGEEGEEDGEEEEDDGRAKKRARVSAAIEKKSKTAAAPTTAPGPHEKRKRGRPRKAAPQPPTQSQPTQPPTQTPPVPHLVLQPPQVRAQQPSTYLLAGAFLFSVFSPGSGPSPGSRSTGEVLTAPVPAAAAYPGAMNGWTAANALVSLLLLLALVAPYLPARVARVLPGALLFAPPAKTATEPQLEQTQVDGAEVERMEGDGEVFEHTEGDGGVVLGTASGVLSAAWDWTGVWGPRAGLTKWRRAAEVEALRNGSSALPKLHAYLALSARIPPATSATTTSTTARDDITLALLAHSFNMRAAEGRWEAARRVGTGAKEALVVGMEVGEAVGVVDQLQTRTHEENDAAAERAPVDVLAAHIVLARVKAHAARLFVEAVDGSGTTTSDDNSASNLSTSTVPNNNNAASSTDPTTELKTLIAAGHELGGPLGGLTTLLDRVARGWPAGEVLATLRSGSDSEDDNEGGDRAGDVDDARALLRATLLYRRLFPSLPSLSPSLGLSHSPAAPLPPTPPPSPTPRSTLHLALRRALASGAFEACVEVEEARDRVVDVLAGVGGRRGVGVY